jgi:rhodanese-related sulfurtransferase
MSAAPIEGSIEMAANPLQSDIVNLFEYTRREIAAFIAGVSEAEKQAIGTPDQWSAKDLLANIGFWQEYMLERMGYYQRGETPPRQVDFDALNLQAHAQYKDYSWDDVLRQGNHALVRLIEAVGGFDDRQLSVNNRYGDSAGGPLWGEIIANGYLYPMEQIARFYREAGDSEKAQAVIDRSTQQDTHFDRYRDLGSLISPSELQSKRQTSSAPLVIDVRSADEYRAGHIAGAVNIPLDDLPGKLPIEQPVVTYCNMHHRGESRGERAAALLREQGYDAATLDGGFPGWQAVELPTETGLLE